MRMGITYWIISASICFICLFPAQVQAQIVDEIRIEGEPKTRPEVIIQEMLLQVGDEFSEQAMQKSSQLILDLGLFRQVDIRREVENGRLILLVTLKEKKHDWYILPRLDRNSDGDITLGANWRAKNFNGLNQTVRLTIAHKDYESATKDKEYRISGKFVYPRIVNTRLSAYFYARATEVSLDEERDELEGRYDRLEYSAGFGAGRWFSKTGVSKGLHMGLGLDFTHYEHDYLGGESGYFDDARFVSLIANVSYTDVQDHIFSRSGIDSGIRLQKADEALASDRSFFYQYAYTRHYILLPFREHTNANFQVQAAHGDESRFGGPIYKLSGGRTLRGYAREKLQGDSYFLVNTEFLTPVFGKEYIRAGALFDFGNAYESFSELKDLDFEYSAGLSLRWKLRQWVDTEIRLDIAQGFGDEGESRVYVAGESTF